MNQIDYHDLFYVMERYGRILDSIPAPLSVSKRHKGQLEINPHQSLFLLENGRVMSVFHVKPIYYLHQDGGWRPMREVASKRGNRLLVLKDDWADKMDIRYLRWLLKRSEIINGQILIPSPYTKLTKLSLGESVFFTISTFYPDPAAEVTSVDGYVRSAIGAGSTWAQNHDATSGTLVDDSSATMQTYSGQGGAANPFYIDRLATLFDTSSIPDTDTITAATYSLYVSSVSDSDNDGNDFITVVTSNPASNTALVVDDYDQIGDAISNPTEQVDTGQRKDCSSISVAAYLDFTLNSTGRGNISKTGVTKFGAREGHDVLNDAVNAGSDTLTGIQVASADDTSGTKDPKLVVTHGISASQLFGLLGVRK